MLRRTGLKLCSAIIGFAVALDVGAGTPPDATGSLVWKRDQVDAHIASWPLPRVLEVISSATGWQIYVEPDPASTVTAEFQDVKPREALQRLLGGLNFAVLPQSNGPEKLFVYRHSVSDATQLVQVTARSVPPGKTRAPIANELIVTLKSGSKDRVDALSKRLHATVAGRLETVHAYRLRFENERAARAARGALEGDGDVASIENNFSIVAPGILEPLSMSSGPAPSLNPNVSPAADRVVIGLLDTAVQNQVTAFKDFVQPEVSLFDGYQPPADQITHGTAMAETILDGVARALQDYGDAGAKVAVSILPIDIYGGSDSTSTFDLARGLYEALNRHANIVNLSLSGDGDSPLLKSLIQDATSHGVLLFAAAGNVPVTSPTYPAADPGVIAVTAGDARGDIASYANRGPFVDAMAPGINVVHYRDSAWLGTGTSFSTSWVSGWAAGFMANAGHSSSSTQAETLKRWAVPSSARP